MPWQDYLPSVGNTSSPLCTAHLPQLPKEAWKAGAGKANSRKCPWTGHQGGWALEQLTEKSKGANKLNLVMSSPPCADLATGRMVRSPVVTHILCLPFEAAIMCLPSNITQKHLLAFEVFPASSLPCSMLCVTFPRSFFFFSQIHFSVLPDKYNCPIIST